jgi:uncharacterized protein YeaO (DUF488 family)
MVCRTLSVPDDERPRMAGSVTDTYAAALQHDLGDEDGTPVGVVRRPPDWFAALVAENRRALGPPEPLLDEAKERAEALKLDGMCEAGAHNAAWEECEFERRYRDYLDSDPVADEAFAALRDRVRAGEDVTLVCFEGENKRCHRRVLADRLRDAV